MGIIPPFSERVIDFEQEGLVCEVFSDLGEVFGVDCPDAAGVGRADSGFPADAVQACAVFFEDLAVSFDAEVRFVRVDVVI